MLERFLNDKFEHRDQSKYKSTNQIYRFILLTLIFGHIGNIIIGLLMIDNNTDKFVIPVVIFSVIMAIISIILWNKFTSSYKSMSKNAITIWAYIDFTAISIISTVNFGWDFGFWFIILGLIFLGYFLTFNSKIITYGATIIEAFILFVLFFLYRSTADGETIASLLNIGITQVGIFNISLNLFIKLSYIFIFSANFLVILRLSSFANIVTAASYQEIAKEKQNLEETSQHDHLTGLLNRRAMKKLLNYELNMLRNNKINGSLVLILGDIDNFKKINDTFGHNVGDIVLKELAGVLKRVFRKNDLLCRWGGEEFVIVLPSTKAEFIHIIKDRILSNVSSIKLPNKNPVTATFGMIICPNGTKTTIEELVERADELLYLGKKNGKDRIEMEILR
ncbi:GGDEF domain-containing protein [Campylobacter sp. 19-13652]|uniref:GGDEF domain-containing protein n=1 Tax=Campylobacter sp. 19-13652 TaxID=2840180 RepID=UPI001C745601|nr:GGDEF domain-containing protein [Campylobacter sp. 19-13652]BCX80205.1 hypothetical protein LBC_16670 [Campylobacter sp. 19-13652]